MGFQIFQRLGDVEDRLGAGAHDGDPGAPEFDQIGGDVERLLGAAMNAADPAGGEDLDAGELGDIHRRRNGGARRAVPGDDRGQIAPRRLDDAARQFGELLQLGARLSDLEPPAENSDRRRRRALGAHGVADLAEHALQRVTLGQRRTQWMVRVDAGDGQ